MKTPAEAAKLARALTSTANGAGTPTAAFITDMSQPLAPSLGNAVEVATCLEILSGNRTAAPRLHDLTVALCARVLALAGHAEGEAAPQQRPARQQPPVQQQQPRFAAAPQPVQDQDPDQERIEIPAFLRRQAN